jgi:hypothetical protein
MISFTYFILVTMTLFFILTPAGLLYHNIDNWSKWENFSCIIGWSVIFAIFFSISTRAKAQETLGAASG